MKTPWYTRAQVEVRVVYQALPGALPVRDWFFNVHRLWRTKDTSGYPCFWVAFSIRVLGFDCGAGLFVSRKPQA